MNCAECGKEIIDEDSSFCAYCGNPFDSKKNKTELLGEGAILLIIAATFTLTIGIIGLMNYQATVAYIASVGGDIAPYLGFLLFGFIDIIMFIPGLLGGLSALFKRRFKFSFIAAILVLCSSLATFIIIQYYAYGYADIVLFSEIPILVFSILSIFLINKSKTEFN
ncbi:MAG: zinc ribbon domain-containing protein [Candidatus Bathyarchaeota archaeon]|nr:zinc ribbon domain-containing protein [Candidatus Bathyarchaeota archaeon]